MSRRPAARSNCGTFTRPRLRSRKRSGSLSGCDTQHVLELVQRNAELCRQLLEGLARPEPLQDVVDPGTPALEDRRAEGSGRVSNNSCVLIGRHMYERRIAVRAVFDATEV